MPTLLRWGRSAYETDASLADEAARLTELGVDTVRYEGDAPPLAGIDILATTSKVRVTRKLLESADLKLVVTTTSGHEHIDTRAARELGVIVARSPMARRDAVVDSSLAMGLGLLRDLPWLQRQAEAGIWARSALPDRPLRLVRDLKVGVVGHGVIGARAAQVWRALGARVLVSEPRLEDSPSLGELLSECGLVTLHCDLNPSSNRMIDAAALARMHAGSILINTARGGLIDADALLEATHLGGIGLDVFPEEPFPRLQELATRDNVRVMPHAAGYHVELGRSVAHELALAVGAFLADRQIPHRVV